MYYFIARYYDPSLGRYISKDPIEHQNLYVYCLNNPINYTDEDGRDEEEMTTSKKGREALFKEETQGSENKIMEDGRYIVYPDQAGKATIGVGHLVVDSCSVQTGPIDESARFRKGGLTKNEALELFSKDLKVFEKEINRLAKKAGVKLKQQEFDALVSLQFNAWGAAGIIDAMKAGKRNQVEFKMEKFKWVNEKQPNGTYQMNPILLQRRTREWKMFSKGEYRK